MLGAARMMPTPAAALIVASFNLADSRTQACPHYVNVVRTKRRHRSWRVSSSMRSDHAVGAGFQAARLRSGIIDESGSEEGER
jgi:hypothetical protein